VSEGSDLYTELEAAIKNGPVAGARCPHCGKGSEDPILEARAELQRENDRREERNLRRIDNPKKAFWSQKKKPDWAEG